MSAIEPGSDDEMQTREIMSCYLHGMKDILPSPLTKDKLISMLEVRPKLVSAITRTDAAHIQKHLKHLKGAKHWISLIPSLELESTQR